MLKDNLNPFTIVSGQNLEEFENDCNEMLAMGFLPSGNITTSSVVGKGDIITVYTQAFIHSDCINIDDDYEEDDEDECECEDCKCHQKEPKEEESVSEKLAKTLLVEPANETKEVSKKKITPKKKK